MRSWQKTGTVTLAVLLACLLGAPRPVGPGCPAPGTSWAFAVAPASAQDSAPPAGTAADGQESATDDGSGEQAGGKEEQPAAGEQQDNAGEKEDGAKGEGGEKPPEGVRRRRPQTAEEERIYKMRKTREDPFLSPEVPGAAPDLSNLYDPRNYVTPLDQAYSAKYIIQDASGKPVGQMFITIELYSVLSRNDQALVTLLYSSEPQAQVRLWLDARTLAPRRLERRILLGAKAAAGDAPAGDASAWEPLQDPVKLNAEYLFDRVSIRHTTGTISVSRALRQLPNAFELESLPVLVRQLDCRYADWPFDAAVTDARHFRSLPLRIKEPGWQELLSAEPMQYRCREVVLQLGKKEYKYYIQSTAPNKLVRFTDGVYTYTLFEYATR